MADSICMRSWDEPLSASEGTMFTGVQGGVGGMEEQGMPE